MENNTNISTIEMETFLSRRLGEKESQEVMEYINTEVDKQVALKITESKNETALWRSEMKNDFATKEDAVSLEKKLIKRVSAVEGTLILWGFVFWFTLIIAMYVIFRFIH